MSKYLDVTGLSHLWDKIKAKFASIVDAVPLIVSTTTAAGVWTGNAPFATLQDGQTIKYWTSHTGVSGHQTTLNLTLADSETTTGAIPVYYRGTSILTNHVPANTCCTLTYRANVTIGDTTIAQGWWLDFAYYKDNDNYDRTFVSNFKPTATGKIIYARQLVFQMSDGTFKSITNSNSTNTSHTACTDKANGLGIINPQIVHFYNATTNVAVGKACGAYMYSAISAIDFRYSSNCGSTLTAQKPVYLVFTYEDGKYYLDEENGWYAQEIPRTANEEEGKYIYMYVGMAYSTYQTSLAHIHPLCIYKNGGIQPFVGNAGSGKSAYEIAVENGYRGTYKSITSVSLRYSQDWDSYVRNGYNFYVDGTLPEVGDTVIMRYSGNKTSSTSCFVGGVATTGTDALGQNYITIDADNYAVLADDGTKTDAELWAECNVEGKNTEAEWAREMSVDNIVARVLEIINA